MAVKHNACQTGFPITIYKGISLSLPFTYKNSDGTPIDLTGKTVVFKLKFGDTVTSYTTVANAQGSVVTITDPPDGEFHILITDEETASMELGSGRWWLELHDSGNVTLLWRDDVTVEDV